MQNQLGVLSLDVSYLALAHVPVLVHSTVRSHLTPHGTLGNLRHVRHAAGRSLRLSVRAFALT
jgi:hypothetical protein